MTELIVLLTPICGCLAGIAVLASRMTGYAQCRLVRNGEEVRRG